MQLTKVTRILYLGNKLSSYGFTPTSVETLGEKLKEDFQVIQASSYKNQIIRLLHMWSLVIKYRKVDYLIIDTYSTSAFIFAWTSARIADLLRLKYIPILHGGNLPNRAKQSPRLLKRYLDNAFEVICPSEFLKIEMESAIGGIYRVIPNYIDLKNYPVESRTFQKKDSIKMFWVRSFHEIYNPYLAVKVLRKLIDEGYEETELCMVGPDKDGSLEKVKQLAKDLDVIGNIKFTGKLAKEEWITLSCDYNIFINTTNVDNTPVSVMEAMALGFPVVTTNVGGISFLIESGKDGLMVDIDNVNQMVNAILSLFDLPSKTSSISKAARNKSEQWDWKFIKKQWKELLK